MSKNVKEFRFGWNAKDAHTNFMELTAEQVGVLMQIINLIYLKRDRIQNDPKWISQSLKDMGSAKCRRIIQELIDKQEIYIDNEGKIGQKRTENEIEIVRSLRKSERNPSEIGAKSERNSRETHAKSERNSAEKKASFEQNQQDNVSLEIEEEIDHRNSGIFSKVLEEIPSLNPELLKAFFEHRNAIGKPVHKNFIPAIISDLKKLAADGDDPNLVIEQTIKNGWSSLQPLKKEKSNAKRKSQKRDLAEQATRMLERIGASQPDPGDDSLL